MCLTLKCNEDVLEIHSVVPALGRQEWEDVEYAISLNYVAKILPCKGKEGNRQKERVY